MWPAGLDVLTVRLVETGGQETPVQLSLGLPESTRLGLKTVSVGGRTVLSLPAGVAVSQVMREWGWADDAVALPGWASPAAECDPAFRNIRAGMGGVPILYRFKLEPKAKANVVLGFCESHWAQAGQRPLICQVEGAPPQEVDRWDAGDSISRGPSCLQPLTPTATACWRWPFCLSLALRIRTPS